MPAGSSDGSRRPPPARPALQVIRDPALGPFLAGNFLSNVGTWLHNVTAAIVVFDLTRSAFYVGTLVAATFGPTVLLSPWAGTIADRVSRRGLLVASQLLAGAGGASLAVWTGITGVEGLPGPWPVIGASFVIGVGYAFSIPTHAALVASLVEPRDLEPALALNTVSFNLGRAIGPAVGAAVLATLGATVAFALNAVSYWVFAVILLLIRLRHAQVRGNQADSVWVGLRFVRGDRVLTTVILAVAALGFASDPVNTLAPAIADDLGGGDLLVGGLMSAFGLGAVVAASSVDRVRQRLSQQAVGFGGLVFLALGMALLAVASAPWTAIASLAIAGVGFLYAITALTARVYERVPDTFRGRVLALWGVAFLGMRPVAGLIDGAIADAVSTPAAVGVASAVAAIAAIMVRPWRSRAHLVSDCIAVVSWIQSKTLARRRGPQPGNARVPPDSRGTVRRPKRERQMDEDTALKWARQLITAEQQRTPIDPLTSTHASMTVEDAYAVQQAIVRTRLDGGDTVVGWKVGLTSAAMQEMLGVDTPDYGPVLSSTMVPDGGVVGRSELIQPKAEAEIAFMLHSPLKGPGVTAQEVWEATAGVAAAIEVIDSRIRDWKIGLCDTVADMASSARVVVSDRVVPLGDWDLRLVGAVVSRNGQVVTTGAGAAVLDNPLHAVAWAANTLGALGITLQQGEVIMPGALHRAVDIEAGDTIEAEFDRLGSVSVRFDD